MARSWSAIADAEPIETDGEVYDSKLDLHYRIQRRDGRLFVREYRLENDEEVHSLEVEAKYAIGSGLHGRSYVAEQNGYLTVLPVGWYADAGQWRLSPGYEQHNQRFDRPVTAQCVGCHSTEPAYVEGSGNRFRPPLPERIGCENCHGPGAAHVAARRRGPPVESSETGTDPTIVNPAHLPPDRQQDVCLQCHLQGEIIVTQPGKGLLDYRPGLPLRDFRSDFFIHDQTGERPGSVSHVPRSHKSRCFTGSNGRLTCATCHDPHLPLGEVPTGFYNSRCLDCHSKMSCSRPLLAGQTPDSGDCVACHMPRVSSRDIGHAVTTEHWIGRRPDAGASLGEREPPPGPPTRLPQGFWGDEPDGQLGSAVMLNPAYRSQPALLEQATELLEQATRKRPDATEWRLWLALGYFQAKRWQDAERTLQEVLRLAPDRIDARELLGRVYVQTGRRQLALDTFEETLRRCPDYAGVDADLAALYFQVQRGDRLLAMLDGAMKDHPPNPLVLGHAARAMISYTNDTQGALVLLRRAQKLDPFLVQPFMLEAQLALERGDWKRAEDSLRGALRAEPDSVTACLALAELLLRTDRGDEARDICQRVLEIQPNNGNAQSMLRRLQGASD
jgi:Tfp pilus assembly protein PilF